MKLKNLKTIKDKLKGKKVLLRLGISLPIKDGVVINDYRIRRIIPTLKFLRDNGAKTIILAHQGRDDKKTFYPLNVDALNKYIKVDFVSDIVGKEATEAVGYMNDGDILLLENVRQNGGEIKNDSVFAKELAKFGDIYVNDAFSTSHRRHATLVGLPKLLPSYVGLLFEEEMDNLSEMLKPIQPFFFIIGGAKFKTKLPLIEKYLKIADKVFVAGALVNNLFKEKGFNINDSLVDLEASVPDGILENKKLMLPKDVLILREDGAVVKPPEETLLSDRIVDIGPKTVGALKEQIKKSKCILWNGPFGVYEEGFSYTTEEILKFLADNPEIKSIVGGGDTLSMITNLGLEDKLSFVSTAGGAMLEFLATGTLPAIEAME